MLMKYLLRFSNYAYQYRVNADNSLINEFKDHVLFINIKRERILSIILMLLTSFVICMSALSFRQEDIYDTSFIIFIGLFMLLFAVAAFFLFFTRKIKEVETYNYKQFRDLHLLINLVVLILGSFGAVNAAMVDEQPFSFVISILSIASVVYLHPRERLLVYALPLAIYIIGSIVVLQEISTLLGNTIYTILLLIFALVISSTNYSSYLRSYVQTKTIQLKNQELDALYKKTDEALKVRTEELSVAKEYELLRTAFFANLSHELRTPINVIFAAEQMLEHLSKSEKTKLTDENMIKYRKIIKQNCFRLIRMVSNLIDITKIDAGYFKINMQNCDIVMIVEDITLSVAEYIESRNIELVFDTEVEEKVIACDPDKIERIILNLLSNSVKYTPVGGRIFVRIYVEADSILISVRDTGIGIPKEMKEIIFDRFIQVDRTSTRANEGSGIGLSIVKSLVELHGGSIYLESELGRGTEFIIKIPDRQINTEHVENEAASAKEQQHIEKIRIEFSDIYD